MATNKAVSVVKEHSPLEVFVDEAGDCHTHGDAEAQYGTANGAIIQNLTNQLGKTVGHWSEGKLSPQSVPAINAALAMVKELEPRDAIERMLSVQMAATHEALMRAIADANRSTYIPTEGIQIQAAVKLGNLFTSQLSALRKHRNPKQVVRIERINVSEGSQAVVGNVQTGGRG